MGDRAPQQHMIVHLRKAMCQGRSNTTDGNYTVVHRLDPEIPAHAGHALKPVLRSEQGMLQRM